MAEICLRDYVALVAQFVDVVLSETHCERLAQGHAESLTRTYTTEELVSCIREAGRQHVPLAVMDCLLSDFDGRAVTTAGLLCKIAKGHLQESPESALLSCELCKPRIRHVFELFLQAAVSASSSLALDVMGAAS